MKNLVPASLSEDLRRLVEAQGLSQVRILDRDEARALSVELGVQGAMQVGNASFTLKIGIPKRFPRTLPVIVLATAPTRAMPHVTARGYVCFESIDSVVLDRRDSLQIVAESVERARETLELSVGPRRGQELLDEFVAAWAPYAAPEVVCVVEGNDEPREVTAFFDRQALVAVADNPEELAEFSADRINRWSRRRAVYVPVNVAKFDDFEPKQFLDSEFIRSCLSARAMAFCEKLEANRDNVIVLGVARPSGGRTLVGVASRQACLEHPLVRGQPELAGFRCGRADRGFLAPRGGASTSLESKSVLLVGCGAVGGHIAMSLARMGVRELTLVDPDEFRAENTFRHVCGKARIGEKKATGLAAELRRQIPYLRIRAEVDRFDESVEKAKIRLRDISLIIVATGAPTDDLHLNEHVWLNNGPPTIFAWLEPLGLGRHVLLTTPKVRSPGCLECLWTRSPMENRGAFAKSNGAYSVDLDGCGTRHIPFASLDAEQLAITVCRVGLQALTRQDVASRFISEKGDETEFSRRGFVTSKRFELSRHELEQQEHSFSREDCPVCSRR